jgi:hypothetical protein
MDTISLLGCLDKGCFPGRADITVRDTGHTTRPDSYDPKPQRKVTLTRKTVNCVFFLSVSFSGAWY